jgi:hypothetical protein
MSAQEFRAFIWEFWWQLGLLGLAVVAWVIRVEAAVSQMERVATDHEIVQGLGRMVCRGDRASASLAGLPCAKLLFYDYGDRQ